MVEWPSDEQLLDAARRVEQAFLSVPVVDPPEFVEAGHLSAPIPESLDPTPDIEPGTVPGRPVESDAVPFTQLYPGTIQQEFDKLERAVEAMESDYLARHIAAMRKVVEVDWSGDAASAFRTQVTDIESFRADQSADIQEIQKSLLASYKLAVLARQDYLEFTDRMLEMIEQFKEQQEAEALETVFTLLGGVVGSVLTVPVSGLLSAGVSFVATHIGNFVAGVPAMINGGSTITDLANSYRESYQKLRTPLQDQVDEVTQSLAGLQENISQRNFGLSKPISSKYADVSSPDFSYKNFFSEWRSRDSELSAAVDRVAADRVRPDSGFGQDDDPSPLRRRLEGE